MGNPVLFLVCPHTKFWCWGLPFCGFLRMLLRYYSIYDGTAEKDFNGAGTVSWRNS